MWRRAIRPRLPVISRRPSRVLLQTPRRPRGVAGTSEGAEAQGAEAEGGEEVMTDRFKLTRRDWKNGLLLGVLFRVWDAAGAALRTGASGH